jgi:hypothetical protein
MLQMKKNTRAKFGALLASVVALGSTFGLVHQNTSATASDTQPAQAVVAPLSQKNTASQGSQIPSPNAQTAPKVHTRTHAS